MGTPSANLLLWPLYDLTTGANRAVIESEPTLACWLPRLDESARTIKSLLGHVTMDDASRAIRKALADDDDAHDGAHRFIFGALTLYLLRGSAEDRAAVAKTLATLYPNGLSSIQVNYRSELAYTFTFINLLQDPIVRVGLEIVEKCVPDLIVAEKEVCDAADSMRANLTKLNDLEAKALATPRLRELFDARRDALGDLSNFVGNVERTFRGTDPARVEQRERLLLEWRRMNAAAAARVDTADPMSDLIDETSEGDTSVSEIPSDN